MTAVDFTHFVEELANRSGEAILPFFRTAIGAVDKSRGGVFDPVTEADRAAEAVMRRMILDQFPHHGIIGEEFGNQAEDAEYCWVLDPIDGTKSFVSGLPVWGTLIGLCHNGRPTYGMMRQPFTRESFYGDCETAHWRGPDAHGGETTRKLRTRACADLASATLMTTSPLLIPKGLRKAFTSVEKQVRLSRYGGDCYAYCMLASGHLDLIIETELKPYDVAALIPIVTGAGGIITTWEGAPAQSGGRIIAAGDKRIHEAAMKLLQGT